MFRINIIEKKNLKKINQHGGSDFVQPIINFFISIKGDISNLNLQNQNRLYLNYTDHQKSILDEIYCLEKKQIVNDYLDEKDRILYWSDTWQQYFLNTISPSDLIDVKKLVVKSPITELIYYTTLKNINSNSKKIQIIENVKLIKQNEAELKDKWKNTEFQKELLSNIYYLERDYRNEYNSENCVIKIYNNIIVENSWIYGFYFQDIKEDDLKYLTNDIAENILDIIKKYVDYFNNIYEFIIKTKNQIKKYIEKAKDIYFTITDDNFKNIDQRIDEEKLTRIYMNMNMNNLEKIPWKKYELKQIFEKVEDIKQNHEYKYLLDEDFDSFDKEIKYKIEDSGNLKKITEILDSVMPKKIYEEIIKNVKLIKQIEAELKDKWKNTKFQKELLSKIYYLERDYRNKYNSENYNNIIVESSWIYGFYFQDIKKDDLKYLTQDIAEDILDIIKKYVDYFNNIYEFIIKRKNKIKKYIEKAKDIYFTITDDDFKNIDQRIDEKELTQIYKYKSYNELEKLFDKTQKLLKIFKKVEDIKQNYEYKYLLDEDFDSFDKEIKYKIEDSGNLKKITEILDFVMIKKRFEKTFETYRHNSNIIFKNRKREIDKLVARLNHLLYANLFDFPYEDLKNLIDNHEKKIRNLMRDTFKYVDERTDYKTKKFFEITISNITDENISKIKQYFKSNFGDKFYDYIKNFVKYVNNSDFKNITINNINDLEEINKNLNILIKNNNQTREIFDLMQISNLRSVHPFELPKIKTLINEIMNTDIYKTNMKKISEIKQTLEKILEIQNKFQGHFDDLKTAEEIYNKLIRKGEWREKGKIKIEIEELTEMYEILKKIIINNNNFVKWYKDNNLEMIDKSKLKIMVNFSSNFWIELNNSINKLKSKIKNITKGEWNIRRTLNILELRIEAAVNSIQAKKDFEERKKKEEQTEEEERRRTEEEEEMRKTEEQRQREIDEENKRAEEEEEAKKQIRIQRLKTTQKDYVEECLKLFKFSDISEITKRKLVVKYRKLSKDYHGDKGGEEDFMKKINTCKEDLELLFKDYQKNNK